jgi:Uma2 family endonuclease
MNHEARQPRRATYQDVVDAPEHMIAEIANARLHLHTRPGMLVAAAKFSLAGCVDRLTRTVPRDWHFAVAPELHFGEDVLVPDLAGWRRERMPAYPDAAFVTLAPDWLCEILSPSTRRFDLTEKRALYGANGVAHLWLLDPEARTLEAFTLTAGAWTLTAAFQEGEDIRAAPFEAIAFPLTALWPD